jgi:hypothetical protein
MKKSVIVFGIAALLLVVSAFPTEATIIGKNVEDKGINILTDGELSFADLRAWWSLYKKEATITYTMDYKEYDYSKAFRIKLYADDQTEPFDTSLWFDDSGGAYFSSTVFPKKLNEKPSEITAIIETEDNPEFFKQTIDVPIGVDISGTVKENLIPVGHCDAIIVDSNCYSCWTDEVGWYHICIWPLEEKPVSYAVTVIKYEDYDKRITRYTPEITPGENLTDFDLDFNSAPSKPTCSYDKHNKEITVHSTDPYDHKIKYGVSWDNDKCVDMWTELYGSGEEASINCEGHKGTVGVIAINEYGVISSWSQVQIKSNVKSYTMLAKILELFSNAFPILRSLQKP